MKYRKKPVVVEAMQYVGPEAILNRPGGIDYAVDFDNWVELRKGNRRCFYQGENFIIETLEGEMTAFPNDYIICGVYGELYPCKPEIFEKTYEKVEV